MKKEFQFIDQRDIFSKFKKKDIVLPFKPPQPVPNSFYFKPFLIGIAIGGILEASMIKFGYYDALIDAERKKVIKKLQTDTTTTTESSTK